MKKDQFDIEFERTGRAITAIMLLAFCTIIAVLGGSAFVIYKILSHFGIM